MIKDFLVTAYAISSCIQGVDGYSLRISISQQCFVWRDSKLRVSCMLRPAHSTNKPNNLFMHVLGTRSMMATLSIITSIFAMSRWTELDKTVIAFAQACPYSFVPRCTVEVIVCITRCYG